MDNFRRSNIKLKNGQKLGRLEYVTKIYKNNFQDFLRN